MSLCPLVALSPGPLLAVRRQRLLGGAVVGVQANCQVEPGQPRLLLAVAQEEVGLIWLNLALRMDPNYRPAQQALAAYREQRTRRQADQVTEGQGTTGINQ